MFTNWEDKQKTARTHILWGHLLYGHLTLNKAGGQVAGKRNSVART